MAQFSIAGRSTVVGTAARAQFSLFSTAVVTANIIEVGVFNTTVTACAVALARFTAATNVGTGLTEAKHRPESAAATCTGFAGHTADGTAGEILAQATLGAAAGSGVIWTFSPGELFTLIGTPNGIGVLVPTGTGQITDYYLIWRE